MGQPRHLLSFIFSLFKQTSLQFLQQKYVKNVHPVYSAGIQTHNHSEHESPPTTTRPAAICVLRMANDETGFIKLNLRSR